MKSGSSIYASMNAAEWQKHIYLNGFSGNLPHIPSDFSRLESAARSAMTPQAFAYVAGGAGAGATMENNRNAFDRAMIIPRMLRNVEKREIGVSLFGRSYSSPFLISPVGVLSLAHKDADIAVARAASRADVPFIFSNQASFEMEKCCRVMGESPRWFQLYWSKSNELVKSFVQRAELCGCSAIVVTLDTTMLGWRTQDLDLGYLPFLLGQGIAQYTSDPVFQRMMDEHSETTSSGKITWQALRGLLDLVANYPGDNFFRKLRSGRPLKAVRKFIESYSNPRTTWEDLKILRGMTKLPIVLKGILHQDDARRAVDSGVDGIIVSNHGGRQVDGAIATLEALPQIVDAVHERIPILLDSGVRGGADAFKAIAMGAKAVCIGRPYVYALAIAGESGVYDLLRNYVAEFELTMALAGYKNVGEIARNSVARA